MVNLCNYCSRRDRCYKLVKLMAAVIKEIENEPQFEIKAEISVRKCQIFKSAKNINKALEHMCISCKNSNLCSLWDQVSNIDEDFIKNAFEYEPEFQSVGIAVNYCKLYQPKI